MKHGELVEIPFSMKKVFFLRLGFPGTEVVREGEETLDDTMLFPAAMTVAARNALIERLLDEAAETEHQAGPAPTD